MSSQTPNTSSDKSDQPAGLGTVVVRNEFYRDGYRSLLRLCLLQGLVIVGLIGAMYFVINIHQPENRYFATTEDGRLIPLVPLTQPNLSTPALLSWTAQAATEVMTFSFNDYKRQLQQASRNFTKSGWQNFTAALERSGIIEKMEVGRQVLTTVPKGAPILESEGIFNGRYEWTVQIPLAQTYESGSKVENTTSLTTIRIVRVPRLENSNGIAIEQWISGRR